jgi:hypothetical protein
MVLTRKYPLEPLKRARAAKVDATARAFAGALRGAASAESEVERRTRARLELEREVAKTKGAELGRLEQGLLKAADLERVATWGVGADLERARQARSVDEARGALARAQGEAEEKRRSVVHSQAEAELVEKHHANWEKACVVEAAAKEEEDAHETHASRWANMVDR